MVLVFNLIGFCVDTFTVRGSSAMKKKKKNACSISKANTIKEDKLINI